MWPRGTKLTSMIKYSPRELYTMECHITPPPPSTNVLQKLVTLPRYTLSTITGTATQKAPRQNMTTNRAPSPTQINPRIIYTDQIYYIVILNLYERTQKNLATKTTKLSKMTILRNCKITEYHLDNVLVHIYTSPPRHLR